MDRQPLPPKQKRFTIIVLTTLVMTFAMPASLWAQASLENPPPGSFQSGVGLISGWVCTATRVDIEIDGTILVQAAYGTARNDTIAACGDDGNNGFGLLFNWNLLGDGTHTVRALREGTEEFARASFVVATLGLGEFPTGLSGAFDLPNFPQAGRTTRTQWQESPQNFAITDPNGSSSGEGSMSPRANLENPQPGSFQSGIGLISGWVCEASQVAIEIDGTTTLQAAYGTSRGDTIGVCGDTNNGFGLLFNWNLLADGPHTVRALQNGAEFARATFVVATLGLGEFPTGLSGAYRLPNFPQTGRNTLIGWQQSVQNFVITGAPPPGVDMNLCTTQTGIAVDPSGGSASLNSTNPCLAAGKTLLLQLQTLLANAQEAVLPQTATRGQGEPQSFLADAASLTFVQGNRTFTSTDFRWLDSSGNAVVGRTLPPGTTLDTTLTVNPESSLSFNSAFSLLYNNQTVVDFPPRPATTVDITGEGTVTASSTFGGNQFPPQRAIDGLQSTSWFSAGPDSSGSTVFTWTGRQDDLISSIVIFSNALNENPSFRTNFGFGAVTVQVLSASGGVIFEQSISLPGTPDPNIQVAPNVVGRSVRLIFSGHEDPGCGGFAELQIMAIR